MRVTVCMHVSELELELHIYNSYIDIVFGPPNVTLSCSADYAMLNKIVELSWRPTLVATNTPLSNEQLDDRIENCGANIQCSGGHRFSVSEIKS